MKLREAQIPQQVRSRAGRGGSSVDLGGSVIWVSARVMIPVFRDRALNWAPCSMGSVLFPPPLPLPTACVFSLSLSNKYMKSLEAVAAAAAEPGFNPSL